jgi:hypothetical protein
VLLLAHVHNWFFNASSLKSIWKFIHICLTWILCSESGNRSCTTLIKPYTTSGKACQPKLPIYKSMSSKCTNKCESMISEKAC